MASDSRMVAVGRRLGAPGALLQTIASARVTGYLLVLPAVLYVLLLIGVPLVLGVYWAFTDVTIASPGTFVGLQNFIQLFGDSTFLLALRNTAIIGVVATILKIVLSVALAFLFLNHFPGRGLLQVLFVLPWTVPIALSVMAWRWMFDSQYSVLSWVLMEFGLVDQRIQWLSQPKLALAAVILVSTWRAVPFGTIVLLAGLTAVPREVVESAMIDGAGWWRRFFKIIVPIIAPILYLALLFDLIFTLSELTVVYLLTGGGPINQTQVLSTYALQVGIVGSQLGRGAALALFLLPVLFVMTVLALRHISKQEGL